MLYGSDEEKIYCRTKVALKDGSEVEWMSMHRSGTLTMAPKDFYSSTFYVCICLWKHNLLDNPFYCLPCLDKDLDLSVLYLPTKGTITIWYGDLSVLGEQIGRNLSSFFSHSHPHINQIIQLKGENDFN